MPTVYYRIHSGDLSNDNLFNEAVTKITNTLDDPKGWLKYGYKFIYVPKNQSNDEYVIPGLLNMYFKTNINMVKEFGYNINRLSAYIPREHAIYFNIENWNGGSASTLPIDRYRTYVINHEVGHAIGLDHAKCPIDQCKAVSNDKGMIIPCKGSIMQQMSKGPDHIYPCIENEYPLDPEYFNELRGSHFGGSNDNDSYILPALFGIFSGCMMLTSML